jgi:hypothetical protein
MLRLEFFTLKSQGGPWQTVHPGDFRRATKRVPVQGDIREPGVTLRSGRDFPGCDGVTLSPAVTSIGIMDREQGVSSWYRSNEV